MEPALDELDPLDWLVAAAARNDAPWARLVFALDRRCGQAVAAASEPIIAQMRLAWWRDVLEGRQAGKGEPLVEALRANSRFAAGAPALVRIVNGWEELATGGDEGLAPFAKERGGGLFAALGANADGEAPGALWALWDMGDGSPNAQAQARAMAHAPLPAGLPEPAQLLAMLARADVRHGRGRPPRFTPRLYMRLLQAQFLRF